MAWKRKVHGGIVGFIGFMLSPLSWWNDLFVNLPLAMAFAWVVTLFWAGGFKPAVILGYWITNVLGFWLMHKGAGQLLNNKPLPYTGKAFRRDLLIGAAYTLVILILIKTQVIQAPADYLVRR